MAITFPTQTQLKNLEAGVDGTDAATAAQLAIGRILTLTSNPTSYQINTDAYNKIIFSGQTNTITSITTTGSPVSGQTLWVVIIGSVSFTFNSTNFEGSTVALPTSSTGRIDVGFIFTGTKWRCVAVA
jgi:hypothetical protein